MYKSIQQALERFEDKFGGYILSEDKGVVSDIGIQSFLHEELERVRDESYKEGARSQALLDAGVAQQARREELEHLIYVFEELESEATGNRIIEYFKHRLDQLKSEEKNQ